MDYSELGSICKQCGRRRPIGYTNNEKNEYVDLECPNCARLIVKCHHCGKKLRAYKTNREDTITVEKCYGYNCFTKNTKLFSKL